MFSLRANVFSLFSRSSSPASSSSSPSSAPVLPLSELVSGDMWTISLTDKGSESFVSSDILKNILDTKLMKKQFNIDIDRGYRMSILTQDTKDTILDEKGDRNKDVFFEKFYALPKPVRDVIFTLNQIGFASSIFNDLFEIFNSMHMVYKTDKSEVNINNIAYDESTNKVIFKQIYFIDNVIDTSRTVDISDGREPVFKGYFDVTYTFDLNDKLSILHHQVEMKLPEKLFISIKNNLRNRHDSLNSLEAALLNEITLIETIDLDFKKQKYQDNDFFSLPKALSALFTPQPDMTSARSPRDIPSAEPTPEPKTVPCQG